MLMIIFYHFNCAIERIIGQEFTIMARYNLAAAMGVSLFFILSGASLSYATSTEFSLASFYHKRFISIFPLFWATYIAIVFSHVVVFQQSLFHDLQRWTFLLTIIGLDGFLLYLSPNYYLIGEWFLGCILIFYVIFPLIKYLFHKNKHLLIIGSLLLCLLLEHFYSLNMPLLRFPPFRVFEFIFGMYISSYLAKNKYSRTTTALTMLGLIIIILYGTNVLATNILFGCISFIFLTEIAKYCPLFLRNNFIRFLSKYSFAAFLIHHITLTVIINYAKDALTSQISIFLLFSLILLIIYLAAFLIYNLVAYLLRTPIAFRW
ncbi:MAG: acyltransferase family protein [Desulfobulbaceae bacterium]|nr:acyltransferase family protein [Desulfobulbaceae bacterium]